MFKRRVIINLIAAGIFVSASGAISADLSSDSVSSERTDTANTDVVRPSNLRTWGDLNAPVSVYVFSSLTCPHCAVFHADVMPELKKTFIDSGKAKLTYVDMPYDAKAMTGTLLARCIDPSLYESFMMVLFQNQNVWAYHEKPRTLMEGYAKVLGADTEKLKTCVSDYQLRKTITEQRNNLSTLYKVTGMPTVIVVKDGESHKIVGTDTKAIISNMQSIMGEK